MQSLERIRVVGWQDGPRGYRFVVDPQRDDEASALVDARLYPGIQRAHRALGFGEPLGEIDLELGGLMHGRRDSGNDVTRQQAHSEPVRIVKNDGVVDVQVKRRGDRYGRSQRAPNLRRLHPADCRTAGDSADPDPSGFVNRLLYSYCLA
jgi:hypothetical protein